MYRLNKKILILVGLIISTITALIVLLGLTFSEVIGYMVGVIFYYIYNLILEILIAAILVFLIRRKLQKTKSKKKGIGKYIILFLIFFLALYSIYGVYESKFRTFYLYNEEGSTINGKLYLNNATFICEFNNNSCRTFANYTGRFIIETNYKIYPINLTIDILEDDANKIEIDLSREILFSAFWFQTDFYNTTIGMHWGHMPLIIGGFYNCTNGEINRINKAINIISNQTNNKINFITVDDFQTRNNISENNKYNIPIDIEFGCDPSFWSYFRKNESSVTLNLFSETLGDTQNYISSTNKEKIVHSEISLYYVDDNGIGESCYPYPTEEIHEILHALGFNHNNNEDSIMYPYVKCVFMEENITNELKQKYPYLRHPIEIDI